jgi:hypothetical protein
MLLGVLNRTNCLNILEGIRVLGVKYCYCILGVLKSARMSVLLSLYTF